jgi:hypothetical protein
MTESDLNTDRLHAVVAEGKRPWGTPRIIESEIASRTKVVGATSTPFPDTHGPGTTQNGS